MIAEQSNFASHPGDVTYQLQACKELGFNYGNNRVSDKSYIVLF